MSSKIIILVVFFLGFTSSSNGQDVAHIKSGVLLIRLHNDKFSFRPGINLGIQAKLGAPGFYLSSGLYYQKFTISEFDKNKYINDRPSYHLGKLNIDAGYENKITDIIRYRAFVGLDMNRILSIDNNSKNINFNNVYEGFVGYNYGFGFNFYFITIDFKQERSFTEFFKDYKKTKLIFSTISIGVVF